MTAFNADGGIHEIPVPSGRLWLCGKHAIAPAPSSVLRALGAQTVVCLVEQHEIADRYPDYVTWLRANEGVAARWVPTHDLHAPPLEDGLALIDELLDRLDRGEGLVVHCGAGIGRAGTTAVAVLVRGGSMGVDQALAHVRTNRPMAGPEVGGQLDFVRAMVRREPSGS